MTKNQYVKIFALYEFMQDNPNLGEEEIRKVIYTKSINFDFLVECDKNIDNFLFELKKHGPLPDRARFAE